ncbi:hypothetical protein EQG49_07520 [Periweissella cryptocerci]|uniref:SHOCT domain-containing protein n=1 Tax=Periweissella cryptocerci TaxID=2506420 RepID=A0A4P6YUC5_9LACO|nr:hypothetical protein [Periweissella cryptocerci]QBO36316.1 hypothetical protein EQG49_07520 [Periweissella cryptocerci]
MGLIVGALATLGFANSGRPHWWMIPVVIVIWLVVVGLVHRHYAKKYFNGDMRTVLQNRHNAHRLGNYAVHSSKDAFAILDEEYARGNIDDATYKHRKAVLAGDTDEVPVEDKE